MDKESRFLQLIEENKGILFKLCRIYQDDPSDRDDLLQEIILQLWLAFDSFRGESKFSSWMYRVALNVAISWYRQAKKKADTVPFNEQPETAGGNGYGETVEREYPLEDAHSPMVLLQKHVAALKELEKALMLLYFEEKSYREIAEIMGITETNVATKVSRIKEKLKQAILNDKNVVYGRS